MRRLHLFELTDLRGTPRFVRDGLTDYLAAVIAQTHPYAPAAARLADALRRAGARRVVDLCSGAGGPWAALSRALEDELDAVTLTDAFPNQKAAARLEAETRGRVRGHREPVDATAVPAALTGFRTMFTGFHHLKPGEARAVLADAVRHGEGIAIFEATERSLPSLLANLLVPLLVWIVTPRIRPVQLSRLAFTYLLPLIPLAAAWDGLVSCLRTYSPDELRALTAELPEYDWDVGQDAIPRSPAHVTWLVGVPRSKRA